MPSKDSSKSRKRALKSAQRVSSKSAKPTVIRGHVKTKKSAKSSPLNANEIHSSDGVDRSTTLFTSDAKLDINYKNAAHNNYRSFEKFSFVRKLLILILTGTLVFGAGLKVGEQTSSSEVDNAITSIVNASAKQLDRDVLMRAAIEGALKASGDEWANYFPKSALNVLEEQNSNMFTGLGIWLNKTRGGQVQISSIQENSPAAASGLSSGDQLLEVNGTDVRGASLTSVTALIRGDIGKKIELLVSRNEKRVLVSLSTQKIALKTVQAEQVSQNVGYLDIASFSRGTAQEVTNALKNLKYSSGVILDLRNNPGGLIEEAVAVAQMFIGNGIIVSYQVNGSEKLYKANNPKPINVPVVVMVNRNTASSAEIVAGAFQDRNRGVLIGERTYGKGSVQEFVTLDDGSKLELTVALYVTPSGKVIDEVGITPDLAVPSRDINIKALQVLGGLSSLGEKK